jgi:hypothetical protein
MTRNYRLDYSEQLLNHQSTANDTVMKLNLVTPDRLVSPNVLFHMHREAPKTPFAITSAIVNNYNTAPIANPHADDM